MHGFSESVTELFEHGYMIFRLSSADHILMSDTLNRALAFFQLEEPKKRRDYFPGVHVGYRFSGIEYSATPDRPDLNDSLSVSSGWQHTVSRESAAIPFYESADRLVCALDCVAQGVLLEIARRYGRATSAAETRHNSWLQINHYRSTLGAREILQDNHEDGHLLTLWHSARPGLEIFPESVDRPQPVTLNSDQILAMPGSLLTSLTGGDIAPLFLRVIRHPNTDQRLALMYFINPSTARPIFSYRPRTDSPLEDIAAVGARNPTRFGLPPRAERGPRVTGREATAAPEERERIPVNSEPL